MESQEITEIVMDGPVKMVVREPWGTQAPVLNKEAMPIALDNASVLAGFESFEALPYSKHFARPKNCDGDRDARCPKDALAFYIVNESLDGWLPEEKADYLPGLIKRVMNVLRSERRQISGIGSLQLACRILYGPRGSVPEAVADMEAGKYDDPESAARVARYDLVTKYSSRLERNRKARRHEDRFGAGENGHKEKMQELKDARKAIIAEAAEHGISELELG